MSTIFVAFLQFSFYTMFRNEKVCRYGDNTRTN
nr:MAG TPA: hypothetical protein [Caudoviricetes sp.]